MSTQTLSPVFTRDEAKAADLALYNALEVVSRRERNVVWAQSSVDRVAGRSKGYQRYASYNMTAQEAVDKAVEIALTDATYVGRQAQEAIDKLREAMADVDAAEDAARAADKWAEHGRWNRYSVVPGGHIHTNVGGYLRECHTLRLDTDVRWAHPVSGDSVAEAIEVYGEALCTHCFKDAPVSQTTGKVGVDADGNPQTKAQADAAKAARQAEKDAKTAAKNAKRVIDPVTGTDVEDEDQRPLKTEVAVRNEILRLLGYGDLDREICRYSRGVPTGLGFTRRDVINNLVKCQALKNGRDEAELMAEYVAKAAKKAARG